MKTLGENLNQVRTKHPLIHNITNYVTVNDVANALLAIGASPIMADECEEVAEMTSITQGLNLNIGTLNSRTIKAMEIAGKRAAKLSHPIVLDPVGAGATPLRTKCAHQLIDLLPLSIIKGNMSEIKALAQGTSLTRGVDVNVADLVTRDNLKECIAFAKSYALETGAVIVITGPIDIVADETKAFAIENGTSMMSSITGTGCMLSAVLCAYCSANKEDLLQAALAGVVSMGIAGEMASSMMQTHEGNASYRMHLIDALNTITPDILESRARYDQY